MALLVISLAFGFSGYLLPWNQLAFFATKVGTDITGAVPFAGPFMLRFLRGGDQITGGTLTRFFGFHVAILPALATVLVGLHVYLVQRHGMSVPPGVERSEAPRRMMPFVPNFLLRDMIGWLAALALLALLAALFPWELGRKADPYVPAPAGIKPEWYFGWMFQTLRMLPSHIAGLEGESGGDRRHRRGGCAVVRGAVPRQPQRDGRAIAHVDRRGRGRDPLHLRLHRARLPAGQAMSMRPALVALVLLVAMSLHGTVAGAAPNRCLDCHRKAERGAALGADPALRPGHPRRSGARLRLLPRRRSDRRGHHGDGSRQGLHRQADAPRDRKVCTKCHASATYMKQFNPQPYIFSVAEYRSSVHGMRIARGDTRVATCTDCHGVHGILTHKDPASPVYKINVPQTCARCHNSDYMKGRSIPTNQYALYKGSVHGKALLEKHDISAPACNDCHGNHGAVPPNVRDIALVCGNCHGREGELFGASKIRDQMLEHGLRGCVTCHSNHDVEQPTDAMIGIGRPGLCGNCHTPGSAGEQAAARIVPAFHALQGDLAGADSLLNEAELLGMPTEKGRTNLKEANDQLVNLRVTLHSFDAKQIDGVLAEATDYSKKAMAAGAGALADWHTRRVGMGLSVIAILFTIGLLVLKIRDVEGEPAGGDKAGRP